MDTRDIYKRIRSLAEDNDEIMEVNDSFDIELNEGFVIETGIVGFTDDGVIVHIDEDAMEYLDFHGITLVEENISEKYEGFEKVEKAAEKSGAKNPAAVAASIGRKKYGKEKFQKAFLKR